MHASLHWVAAIDRAGVVIVAGGWWKGLYAYTVRLATRAVGDEQPAAGAGDGASVRADAHVVTTVGIRSALASGNRGMNAGASIWIAGIRRTRIVVVAVLWLMNAS